MTNHDTQDIWIDVIEDVPGLGCNTTTIRLDGPLHGRGATLRWLEAHGYCDIVDFRIVVGERVMPWVRPELEWLWIQNMTGPYSLPPTPGR